MKLPITDQKAELVKRANDRKILASGAGRTAIILPYPYDKYGLEDFPTLSREEYTSLLQENGFTPVELPGSTDLLFNF